MKVTINNWQHHVEISRELVTLLDRLTRFILQSEGRADEGEVSVNLVDNERIQELNKTFRGLDRETDVLSFNLDEEDDLAEEEDRMLGDVVISAEKAVEQAEEQGVSFVREVATLTAHGILHLLGYDHESDKEEREMNEKQKRAVEEMGL